MAEVAEAQEVNAIYVERLGQTTPALRNADGTVRGLAPGRTVHYVLHDGPCAGECRPAVVVKVWNKATGCVNLQVLLDGTNDGFPEGPTALWRTSVLPHFDEFPPPGTWHWPERA